MARLANPTMVNVVEAEKAILELERTQGGRITLSEFLRLNLQRFKATGLSRRTIYDSLTRSGIKLGTFAAFSKCWSWLESNGKVFSSKTSSLAKTATSGEEIRHKQEPEKSAEQERKTEKEVRTETKAAIEAPKKKSSILKPIYVNGVEVQIDPETGAKTFQI